EAHRTENLAELVCSNSFRSGSLAAPAGLLKAEMRQLDSLVIRNAEAHSVPAASALSVDRDPFSRSLTAIVEALPSVRIMREEIREIPAEGVTILATVPLTSTASPQCLA